MMATPFKLDHDELARCALQLREAMLEFRKKVIGYYEQEVIDQTLDALQGLLDLCIAKELKEPFNLIIYINPRIFGDILMFPELTKPYYQLADLLRGGIGVFELDASEYRRRLPRQLREPPEYIPSQKTLDAIHKPLPPNLP